MTSRIESLEAQRDRALESAMHWRKLYLDQKELYDGLRKEVTLFMYFCMDNDYAVHQEELQEFIDKTEVFPDYYD